MSTTPKISQAEAKLAAIQTERSQLDTREPQINARAEQIAIHELPAAEHAHNVARVTADTKDDLVTASKVADLRREQANCAATISGITVKRQQLQLAETQAHAALERAKAAQELVKAREHGRVVEEMGEDFFEALGALVTGSIRPAIAHLNREDARGAVQAFDEGALARWIITKCSQAGVDLHTAGAAAMHLAGTSPSDTAATVCTVIETL